MRLWLWSGDGQQHVSPRGRAFCVNVATIVLTLWDVYLRSKGPMAQSTRSGGQLSNCSVFSIAFSVHLQKKRISQIP